MASLKLTCAQRLGKKIHKKEISGSRISLVRVIPCTLLLILFAFFLSSCSSLVDFENSQEFHSHIVGVVQQGQSIGQTFIPNQGGLDGIQLWLKLIEGYSHPDGVLSVELYDHQDLTLPIASQTIPFEAINKDFPITVNLRIQNNQSGNSYLIKLSTDDGLVQVFGRNENNYLSGNAFHNDSSIDADIAFRLMYCYNLRVFQSDVTKAIKNIGIIIPVLFVIWLPGNLLLAIAHWLRPQKNRSLFDWGERMGISIGLSTAILPLVLLWTSALRIRINNNGVYFFFAFLVILYLLFIFLNLRKHHFSLKVRADPHAISLFLIFILSFAVRLIMVRDMAGPAWVDSIHHAVITRLIVENGQIPTTYSPYIDTVTNSYHPGFHINLAAFQILSGLDLPNAMLLFGQVLNALCVFAAYLFTSTIVKDRTAGVVAALITGLITPMPAYYTSWGRYTQLVGLLILPTAYALLMQLQIKEVLNGFWTTIRSKICLSLDLFLLASIASAGLLITHYRVFAFLLLLLVSLFFAQIVLNYKVIDQRKSLFYGTAFFGVIFLLTFLLTLSWWPNTFFSMVLHRLIVSGVKSQPFADFNWKYLTSALGIYALIIAGIGLIWAMKQKQFFSLQMIIWIVLLFLSANLGYFALPGREFINNTSVVIMLFLPTSLFCGYIISWVINHFKFNFHAGKRYLYWFSIITIASMVALIGAAKMLPILNPGTMFLRKADYAAMDWIQSNIPKDESILINSFFWGYGLYAGGDGGFWITPLTGRKTMPQPVLIGMGDNAAVSQRVSKISRDVNSLLNNPKELYEYLHRQSIHYLYLGAKGGAFSPRMLNDSPYFQLIYSQDGVWIFELEPAVETLRIHNNLLDRPE